MRSGLPEPKITNPESGWVGLTWPENVTDNLIWGFRISGSGNFFTKKSVRPDLSPTLSLFVYFGGSSEEIKSNFRNGNAVNVKKK